MKLKEAPLFFLLFCSLCFYAQNATEIYLFNLEKIGDNYRITNPINISNQIGYDDQPSFSEDGDYILFSSFRNGQADIARYDIEGDFRSWLTHTEEVSEHSPQPYPNKKKNFTCIRFDKDGNQRLYKYYYKGKSPEILLGAENTAYYVWIDRYSLAAYTLGDVDQLKVAHFKYKIRYPIQSNIGRSLNRIPKPDPSQDQLISYIDLNHESAEIYSINPQTSISTYLIDALPNSQDLTWTKDGTILMAGGSQIFKYNPKQDKDWMAIEIDSQIALKDISRLVVSPNGKKIAIVIAE